MQTIFPILRYLDVRAAIRWLGTAFGFVEVFSVPEDGPTVRHAQLRLGSNIIMLGSVRGEDGIASPQTLGVSTQALYMYVDDLDAHFEQARRATPAAWHGRSQDTAALTQELRAIVRRGLTCG